MLCARFVCALCRVKTFWPIVATLRRSIPRAQRSFLFYMDPLTNGEDPRFYLQVSKMEPHGAPLVRTMFSAAWVGWKKTS